MLSVSEQCEAFDKLRDQIDIELRATGFEEVLAAQGGFAVLTGRLVVARSFEYTSQAASIDTDLDPLAKRIGVVYEVGTMAETVHKRSYRGLRVGFAFEGETAQPYYAGTELDYIQILTAFECIDRLRDTKANELPFITKSLKKVDIAGD